MDHDDELISQGVALLPRQRLSGRKGQLPAVRLT